MSRYIVEHPLDSDNDDTYVQRYSDDDEEEEEEAEEEVPVCAAAVPTSFITTTGNEIFRCMLCLLSGRCVVAYQRAPSCCVADVCLVRMCPVTCWCLQTL